MKAAAADICRFTDSEEPKYSKQPTVSASTLWTLQPTLQTANTKTKNTSLLPAPSILHSLMLVLPDFCIRWLPFLVTFYLVWSWFVFGFVALPFHAMLYFTLDTWAPLSPASLGSRSVDGTIGRYRPSLHSPVESFVGEETEEKWMDWEGGTLDSKRQRRGKRKRWTDRYLKKESKED